MAKARGRRGCRGTSSWSLLKDSVIFVLVMCVLQVLHAHFMSRMAITNAEIVLQYHRQTDGGAKLVKEVLKEAEQEVEKIVEKIFHTSSSSSTSHSSSISSSSSSSEVLQAKDKNSDNSILRVNDDCDEDNDDDFKILMKHKKVQSDNEMNELKKIAINCTMDMDTTNTNTTKNTQTNATANVVGKQKNIFLSNKTLSNSHKTNSITQHHVIRENVMLPSKDPEREARLLYEKSLLEYHAANVSAAAGGVGNTKATQKPTILIENGSEKLSLRTLHSVCDKWTQRHCHCTGSLERLRLTCRSIGILAVPVELPGDTIVLDLGNNNITNLGANSFFMVANLEELTLSDNSLINIDPNAFYGLSRLKRLRLQNCGLKSLPANSFQGLTHLVSLQLNGNALASMERDSLQQLIKLRTLHLEGNLFYRIPTNALAGLKTLEALDLGSNLLTIIDDDDFPRMPSLVVLLLKRNQIMRISPGAFTNLTSLKVLELDDNLISSLPDGLNKLKHLQEFSITSNRVRWINDTDLPRSLQTIDFRANPLSIIVPNAFRNMPKLRKLILSDVRSLKNFPELEGCYSLEILKLDRAGIADVPANLCRQTPRLKSLQLKTNSLVRIPNLANCRELRLLDLSSNRIETLQGRSFFGLKQLHDLLLSYNRIRHIPHDAFVGIPRLQLLDLEGNVISSIHKDAFVPFIELEDLNLGNNIFPELPSNGLHRLLHLKTFNNPKLREFPAPETFPRIQTLILSYAYHCCPFIPLIAMSATKKPSLVQEAVLFPTDTEFDMSLWNNSMLDIWPQLNNLSKNIWNNFGHDFKFPGSLPTFMEEYFDEDISTTPSGPHDGLPTSTFNDYSSGLFSPMGPADLTPGAVQCLPMPGPFLPCADLFDWWTLRCGVWVVFLLALLGNGTVVFVLIFSRSKMDVPRFLVCNLAAADFFMGIYLGILAIVDASTLGEFRMFAIPWQMSVVCQIAGFLAVLSSELSVYTLAVITLERNYAITHAIHLNKRLTLKQAVYIMIVGWSFSIVMALLPLAGISDYRKFAVCLPFETTTGVASLTYVIGLMVINGCAFLTLMGCYLKMYWAIRGSQAWNTNDSRIAKRMALLVFTDFLCWSPIAFFSITAIFGLQLISLEQAKIFTVFVLPLNSCCNPFLYAIMTKQFKKDCINLCKHFEETRVTRGGAARRGAERPIKELPPLLPAVHPPGCRCLRMLPHEMPNWHKMQEEEVSICARTWQRFTAVVCGRCCARREQQGKAHKTERRTRARNLNTDPYQYQFSEIKQKKQTRASSISSENFCSSRSSSWRNGPPPVDQLHTCQIPMKMIDPNRRRHSAWLITRKTSQDSNLSSSRNDSSASATTASTSTFRLSRSSAGSTTPLPSIIAHGSKTQQHQYSNSANKPRLVRQEAVQEEEDSSPPRLGVRFLPTIPSAADSSVVMDDDSALNAAASFMDMPLPGVSSGYFTVMQKQTPTGSSKAVLSPDTTSAATKSASTSPQCTPTDQPP